MLQQIEIFISISFLFAKLKSLWIENLWINWIKIWHTSKAVEIPNLLQFLLKHIETIRFYEFFNF